MLLVKNDESKVWSLPNLYKYITSLLWFDRLGQLVCVQIFPKSGWEYENFLNFQDGV